MKLDKWGLGYLKLGKLELGKSEFGKLKLGELESVEWEGIVHIIIKNVNQDQCIAMQCECSAKNKIQE